MLEPRYLGCYEVLKTAHEGAINSKGTPVMYVIAATLLVLWLLGLVTSFTLGGLIHASW